MGMTGVGKSTFIKTVTQRTDIVIGHTLNSQTSEVQEYEFWDAGVKYVLVDTPGFDDTHQSDQVITTKILQWLASSYRKRALLNGVVYLHRLSDPRMGGKALSNLFMFRRLCGPQALKSVILATTFWESLSPSELGSREEELVDPKKDFWSKMVAKGSQVKRLGLDRESGLGMIREIAKNHKVTFQVQDDIVNHGVDIQDAAREAMSASQKGFDEAAERLLEDIRQAGKANKPPRWERPRLDSLAMEMLEEEKRWDEQIQEQRKAELDDLAKVVEQQRESIRRRREQNSKGYGIRENIERSNHKVQKNGDCKEHKVPKGTRPRCSSCRIKIGRKGFYHCCLCEQRCFLQCVECGSQCPNTSHPEMRLVKSTFFWFI
ncbi:uncharacterized protein BDZ99DRAFT_421524 [Mytilinidion resinicola]|uniref:G domain-containing protein n=1 Tax=Mytilinidion resinicola TaxID=574789 RepID=A0A6A6YHI0_9PEZI|nr:uncharacterized protein BDZ99DRAFT_421524 [Mytilinidion resinicola]KAF2807465.1 hypothetical protein BDZ99DRAFT_421524 [Mytilinidion resinicola]